MSRRALKSGVESGAGVSREGGEERRLRLLSAIVRGFIGTGLPIGSKSLAGTAEWDLSAATIRGLMADLESDGLLRQTHASSGRVPTVEGYRLYVERLLVERKSNPAATDWSEPPRYENGFVALLQETSRALSEGCDCVGLVLQPVTGRARCRSIHLLRLTGRRIVVVVESDNGIQIERVVSVASEATQAELDEMGRYIERRFQGSSVNDIHRALRAELAHERTEYDVARRRLLELVLSCLEPCLGENQVLVEGTSRCLELASFEDVEAIRRMVRAYEQKDCLASLLASFLDSEGIQVQIGSERDVPELPGLALVVAKFGDGERPLGCVGVLGPIRMPYERAIHAVDHAARRVSQALQSGFVAG